MHCAVRAKMKRCGRHQTSAEDPFPVASLLAIAVRTIQSRARRSSEGLTVA